MDGENDSSENDGLESFGGGVLIDDDDAGPNDDAGPSDDAGPRDDSWAPAWLGPFFTVLVVGACCAYVFWVVHPELIFSETTPTGGDMGAHLWGPAYLRDHLLPSGRLTGWTQDWYAGFPAYTFYMVVPSLAIVILDIGLVAINSILGAITSLLITGAAIWAIFWNRATPGPRLRKIAVVVSAVAVPFLLIGIPYNIAFKLVAVSGIVALPAGVWYLMSGLSLRRPGPELAALASVAFLMDKTIFHIYGGNIASTMAGEFAFSISLALALFALGSVARGLRDGNRAAQSAVLLSLAALCHVIPAFFALFGALYMFVLRPTVKGLAWSLTVGMTALLLAAWWYVPFFGRRSFLNDMGWEKLAVDKSPTGEIATNWDQVRRYLLPFGPHDINGTVFEDPNMFHGRVWFVLAAVGVFLSIVMVVRSGIWLTMVCATSAVAFVLMPQDRFWNARVLPFYYLSIYLLAAVGVTLLVRTVVLLVAGRWIDIPKAVAIPVTAVAIAVMFVTQGLALRALPLGSELVAPDGSVESYQWLFFKGQYQAVVSGWAEWNFSGLERKGALLENGYQDSNEYFGMINEMDRIGEDVGCGRAMWEYNSDINKYGTPMAPMLLPYFTDGCIGSMEGLYFEASSTTPFHFLVQSELSESPSRPQRFDEHLSFDESPYADFDMQAGITHLQMMGVRYYMAKTEVAKDAADMDGRLTRVGFSSPWAIYEIADSDVVEPLANLPVEWTDVDNDIYSWARPAVEWFNSSEQWDVYRSSGDPEAPEGWPRAAASDTVPVEPAPSPDAEITNVVTTEDSLSFDVDEPGSPVLVKMSYFPNWDVEGAEGPYRVAPNFMVVVPTETSVSMTYGRSTMENVAWLLTLIGVAGAIALALRRPFRRDDDESPFEFFGDRDPSSPEQFWADTHEDTVDGDTVDRDTVDRDAVEESEAEETVP